MNSKKTAKATQAVGTKDARCTEKDGFVKFAALPNLGAIPFSDCREGTMMKWEIRQEDIDGAVCGDPMNCVMAKSGQRNYGPLFDYIIVGKTVIHIIHNGRSTRFGMCKKLQAAIHYFDTHRDANGNGIWVLPPGVYYLTELSPTARRGGRPFRGNLYGGKGGKAQGLSNMMSVPSRVILNRKAA